MENVIRKNAGMVGNRIIGSSGSILVVSIVSPSVDAGGLAASDFKFQ
jgi:hypothetical protein